MSWIFGPQAWHLSEHAYNRRRGSFPCIGVLFLNNSTKRCIKISVIYLSWQGLCSSIAATHHIWVIPVLIAVPLSSTGVSDHPELTNDSLLNTRTNISMLPSGQHFSFADGFHRTEEVGFSSQHSVIVCVGPSIWVIMSPQRTLSQLVVLWLHIKGSLAPHEDVVSRVIWSRLCRTHSFKHWLCSFHHTSPTDHFRSLQ